MRKRKSSMRFRIDWLRCVRFDLHLPFSHLAAQTENILADLKFFSDSGFVFLSVTSSDGVSKSTTLPNAQFRLLTLGKFKDIFGWDSKTKQGGYAHSPFPFFLFVGCSRNSLFLLYFVTCPIDSFTSPFYLLFT